MRTTAFKRLLITIILSGSLLISQNGQYPDSLFKYLEVASENNPALLQQLSEYQAALQRIPQAGGLPDPELSTGVFLRPMELVSGNQMADIRLMQMFPWPGVLRNASDEMSLMANAKYELLRDAKLQVHYDVRRTWYDLFKIRRDKAISEKNIEILKMIERLALAQFSSGQPVNTGVTSTGTGMTQRSVPAGSEGSGGMQSMGAGQGNSGSPSSNRPAQPMTDPSMGSSSGVMGLSDLFRIRMEVLELENKIAMLNDQEQAVVARFNSYLNRSPSTPVYTDDTLSTDLAEIPLLSDPDSTLSESPMLNMLKFETQSVEARKKMVTAMGYPMIGVGINYSVIGKNEMSASPMNGNDMVMPMVSLTLPVYRKKYKAMVREADLMKTASAQNYQATASSLQAEYYQAVQLYLDAQRRIKLYEELSQLASKSLDLMITGFSSSSSGLTDVLRVQQQSLGYELLQVEAVADFNTAVARLDRLITFSQIQ